MFIPLKPDGGADHFPWATLSLMGICVLMHLATELGIISDPHPLCLVYGEFNPVQWFTSAVMHADLEHLIGNLFFLYTFGIVVEGLVGTPKFLVLIATTMIIEGCITQLLMSDFEWSRRDLAEWRELGVPNPPPLVALGASGFIFAIMAAAMIWAPTSRIVCLWLFGVIGGVRSIRVRTMVVLYILFNVWQASWETTMTISQGNLVDTLTTPWLHLIGAGAGALMACVFMATGLIDTDGWHLFGEKTRRRTGL